MKIDFSQPVTALDGVQFVFMPEQKDERGAVVKDREMATLGNVCVNALGVFQPKEISWVENLKRQALTERILTAEGPVEMTSAEVTTLIGDVGRWPIARIASECVRMLDEEQWRRARA